MMVVMVVVAADQAVVSDSFVYIKQPMCGFSFKPASCYHLYVPSTALTTFTCFTLQPVSPILKVGNEDILSFLQPNDPNIRVIFYLQSRFILSFLTVKSYNLFILSSPYFVCYL